jgi:hypothetical protein
MKEEKKRARERKKERKKKEFFSSVFYYYSYYSSSSYYCLLLLILFYLLLIAEMLPFLPSAVRCFSSSSSLTLPLPISLSSSSPSRSSILSLYRRLLRSVSRTSIGYHEIVKTSSFSTSPFRMNYRAADTKFLDYIRNSFRSPTASYEVAQSLWELCDGNLEHSRYLSESGWGMKQEGKQRISHTAARVGLEVAQPGQEIKQRKQTKLTGTAGEGYIIGKGSEVKGQPFDLSELEAIKNK